MKLVMTVLARDEADIIDAQIAFHLNAGVDFVIATDNASQDGTREILEAYASEGYLHVIDEPAGELRQQEWVSRMARLAASEFGADWVINSDADEFWWPRGGSLKDVVEAVPYRYGILLGTVRHFVPRPPGEVCFAERMTVRLSPSAAINDPASPFRPLPKVVHRADPRVTVARGSHALLGSPFEAFRSWRPIETLHFPVRSVEQIEHKALLQWSGFASSARGHGTGYHASAYRARSDGRSREYYDALSVDDHALAQGLAIGVLTVDTRLRDALRALRVSGSPLRQFDVPSRREGSARGVGLRFADRDIVEDTGVAVDAAILRDADVIRHSRDLDELEIRLGSRVAPSSSRRSARRRTRA